MVDFLPHPDESTTDPDRKIDFADGEPDPSDLIDATFAGARATCDTLASPMR